MKKLSYIMLFLLLAFVTQAELVDDFNGYNLGLVNTVAAPNWVAGSDNGTSPSTASIVVDPVDSGNQVMQVTEGGGTSQQWAYKILSPTATIADGAISTMYVRFKATAAIDESFGLTDVDVPGADWNHFRLQFVVHNAIQIRDGSSVRDLNFASTGTAVPFNTDWYNLWIVVNNSTDTVSLYLNQTGQDATEADRLVRRDLLTQTTFAFRSAGAALDRFFWRAQNNANTRLLMIDDINITPGTDLSVPAKTKPYGPSVEQGTPSGTSIPTTLKWKAGADPAGTYAVNPDIVDEYVFMGSDLDPNLRYVGATGVDPGTTDPNSEYSLTRTVDRTYYWAIVEAMSGHTQTFSMGSLIGLVDPNNIIGSTWSYESTKSTPVIVTHPADARVFATEPNAVFVVTFTSVNPVTATWKKNDVAIIPDGTNVIVTTTSTSSKLQINTPDLTDEGKYYCVLSVDPGVTTDDATTYTRLLVIKKELARFDFENSLADGSGNSAPAGIVKTVSLADPNEMKATVVTLPSYVSGIDGMAISLDGTQFIDFGTEGYPKAGPLDTIGDIRGTTWNKQGFGRGMDEGSILCWIKLASDGVVYTNANNNTAPATDDTHFALSTNGTTSARIIIRGENVDGTAQNLGEANGAYQMAQFTLSDGQWHMFAATWSNSTARIYVNGEEVANNTQGYTEVYKAWERSNLLGASRTAARHILNAADFVTGSIDKLRVYNYVISAADIASEYESLTPNQVCFNHSFAGYEYNIDNTAGSYCVINLGDFVLIAQNWLSNGF